MIIIHLHNKNIFTYIDIRYACVCCANAVFDLRFIDINIDICHNSVCLKYESIMASNQSKRFKKDTIMEPLFPKIMNSLLINPV